MHYKESKTALLLDDHIIIRHSCRSLLEKEKFLISWEGSNGDLAIEAYREHHPNLCIIDLSIEGTSGLETIEKILEYDQTAKIIVFSMYNDPMFIKRVLKCGVFGYITKTSEPSNLTNAIKYVMKGKYYLSEDINKEEYYKTIDVDHNLLSTLTKQETNVFLQAIRGLNSTAIGKDLKISTKSVSAHLYKIKQKLGAKNIPDLIKIALCHGIDLDS